MLTLLSLKGIETLAFGHCAIPVKYRDRSALGQAGDVVLSATETVMRRYQHLLTMRPDCIDEHRFMNKPLASAIAAASNNNRYVALVDSSFTAEDISGFHEESRYLRERGLTKEKQVDALAVLIGTTREMAAFGRHNADADPELIEMMDEAVMLNYD